MSKQKRLSKDTWILYFVIIGILIYSFIQWSIPETVIDLHSKTGVDTIYSGNTTYIVKFEILETIENEDED